MKFCTGCGSSIEDNVKFCPFCGAKQDVPQNTSEPTYTQPSAEPTYTAPAYTAPAYTAPAYTEPAAPAAPAKKNKKKKKGGAAKILIPIVAVLAVAAIVVGVLMSGILMNPAQRFLKVHETVADSAVTALAAAVTGNYDEIPGYQAIDTDATLTFDSDTGEDEIDDILNDTTLTVKAKVEPGKDSVVALESDIAGTDVLTGTVTWGEDYLGLQVPALSDDYYKLALEDVPDLLDELGLDMDEDTVSMLWKSLTGSQGLTDMKQADVEKLLNKYLDIVYSAVTKDNVEKSKGEIDLYGLDETVSCDTLTFTPSSEDISAMVETLIATVEDDDDLMNLFVEICSKELLTEGYDIDDAQDEAEDAWDGLLDSLDEIDPEDIGDELEDAEFTIVIGYSGSTIYFYQISRDDMAIEFEQLVDGSSYSQALCEVDLDEEEVITMYLSNEMTVKGDTVKGEMTYTVDQWLEENMICSYEISTKDRSELGLYVGSYEISYEVNNEDYADYYEDYLPDITMEISAAKKGHTHEIEVEMGEMDFVVTIETTDSSSAEVPSGKAVAFDADSYEDILDEWSDSLEDVISELGDIGLNFGMYM